jgi:hypothetical protein
MPQNLAYDSQVVEEFYNDILNIFKQDKEFPSAEAIESLEEGFSDAMKLPEHKHTTLVLICVQYVKVLQYYPRFHDQANALAKKYEAILKPHSVQ